MLLPSTCRCIRVFSNYKLNKAKMELFRNQLEESNVTSTIMIVSLDNQQSNQIEMVMKENPDNKVANNEIGSVVEKVGSLKSMSDSVDTFNMEIPNNSPTRSKVDYSSLSKSFQISFLQFISSYKFVALVYVSSFVFNSLFWLVMAGIEMGVDRTGKKFENGASQLFVYPGMFEFKFGCVLTINGLILVSCLTFMYLIFEIASIVLLLMADRDTWSIKTESIVIVITQFIGIILFVVLGNISGYITLVDYIIPYSLFLFFFVTLEIIITVVRPIVWEIYLDFVIGSKSKNQSNDVANEEAQVINNLSDEGYYQRLLDFARRCYCPESLLCWKSIQKYKKENYHDKRLAAHFILEQFLTIGAPTELNIENVELRKRLIITKIESEEHFFGIDLFDEIENHCVNDLADLIHRFKFSNQ